MLQASGVTYDVAPLTSDPSPRVLENHEMLLSDFTQEEFSFPANLDPTLQVSRISSGACLTGIVSHANVHAHLQALRGIATPVNQHVP